MRRISIATATDADDITKLRINAFARSEQFRMSDNSDLEWGPHDEEGVVLAAWEESGDVISTTRGEVLHDPHEAERHMMSTFPLGPEVFPAVLLTRGATREGYGKSGLHSALRFYFLEAARKSGFASMLGLVYQGAPRLNLMQEIGYELIPAARNWETEAEILTQPLVAWLPRQRMDLARERLQAMIGDTLREYPWAGQELVLTQGVRCAETACGDTSRTG